MTHNLKVHHRHSIRLPHWDYSWGWWYYVTMVINNRAAILGNIRDGKMRSHQDKIVRERWVHIPERFGGVDLDDFVIMPNHVHGIIIINDEHVGAIRESPQQKNAGSIVEDNIKQRRQMKLSTIVGWFKMNSAKQINETLRTRGKPVWQRNYYDHIIRNEADLSRI